MLANQIFKRFLTVTTAVVNETLPVLRGSECPARARTPFIDRPILYREALLRLAGFCSLCCILVVARYSMNIVEFLSALETVLRI
jgi:hypothetical protein